MEAIAKTSAHDVVGLQSSNVSCLAALGKANAFFQLAEQVLVAHAHENPCERPFLSIIMRTQGKRNHTLCEALLCLTAQTDLDFDLILISHRTNEERDAGIKRCVDDLPAWMRARVRTMTVADGNRTRPLNIGFEKALGSYIAILDDDDVVMANWVETFRDMAASHPGQLLRATTARQDVRNVTVQKHTGLRAEGPPDPIYPSTFDWISHLHENQTPPVSISFPRQAFHCLGIRFDEALTTTEDWDYILRTSEVCGVASSVEITSIYRWWIGGEVSSRTEHATEEWNTNRADIRRKSESRFAVLDPIAMRSLRRMSDEHAALIKEIKRLRKSGVRVQLSAAMGSVTPSAALHAKRRDIRNLLGSKSWRISAPIRYVGVIVLRRGVAFDIEASHALSADGLDQMDQCIRNSTSWRLTAPLRYLAARRLASRGR